MGTEQKFCEILKHDQGVKRPPRAGPASPPGTGYDQGVKRPPRAGPASPPGTAANVLGGAPMGGAGACIGKRAYKKRLNVYPDKASHISERLIDQMKVITAI